MSHRTKTPLASRLLALLIGVFFALQPAVRAAGCETRSALQGLVGRSCCCAAMQARGPEVRSCCSEKLAQAQSEGPRLLAGSCDCGMNAPAPNDALPRSTDSRSAGADGERAAANWIAQGARASAVTAWFPVMSPPGSRSDPSPPSGCIASREKRLSCPDVVARSCERGVNGLLAVLGVVRL